MGPQMRCPTCGAQDVASVSTQCSYGLSIRPTPELLRARRVRAVLNLVGWLLLALGGVALVVWVSDSILAPRGVPVGWRILAAIAENLLFLALWVQMGIARARKAYEETLEPPVAGPLMRTTYRVKCSRCGHAWTWEEETLTPPATKLPDLISAAQRQQEQGEEARARAGQRPGAHPAWPHQHDS